MAGPRKNRRDAAERSPPPPPPPSSFAIPMSTESIFVLPAALFSSPLAAVLDAKQAGARAALLVGKAQERYAYGRMMYANTTFSEQKRVEAERLVTL